MRECIKPAAGSRSSVCIHTPARKSAQPPMDVALGGAAVVGLATLVVADAEAHQPRTHEEHHRDARVEGPVHTVGHVHEVVPGDLRVLGPFGDPRCQARRKGEQRDDQADDQNEDMRLRYQAAHGASYLLIRRSLRAGIPGSRTLAPGELPRFALSPLRACPRSLASEPGYPARGRSLLASSLASLCRRFVRARDRSLPSRDTRLVDARSWRAPSLRSVAASCVPAIARFRAGIPARDARSCESLASLCRRFVRARDRSLPTCARPANSRS